MNSIFRNLVREPLTHFLLLGVVIFLLFAVLNDDSTAAADEVVVDTARVSAMISKFKLTWQRLPTTDELDLLIDGWIREEILYREGIALGLDQNDAVVRRRIAQKMDLILEGTVQTPDTAALQTWLDEHREKYLIPPQFAFEQRFFDPQRHAGALPGIISSSVAALNADEDSNLGDPTMLPDRMTLTSIPQIDRIFGTGFGAGLAGLPLGEWSGPVSSTFGEHVVRVSERQAERMPALDEVRGTVERDLLRLRVSEFSDQAYEVLRQRYVVRIDAQSQLEESAQQD